MKIAIRITLTALLLSLGAWAQSTPGTLVQQSPTDLSAATQSGNSSTSAATITLPAVGGQYQYITGITIDNCAGSSAVTAAAATTLTTTNLVGSPKFLIGSGVAAGLCQPTVVYSFTKPLKSSAPGTATTFVLPTFATNQTINVNVMWYNAP